MGGGRMGVNVGERASFGLHGRLTLTSVNADWFREHRQDTALMMAPPDSVISDRHEGDNTMCTNGLTVIAAALVWAGIQDQASSLGVTSTYLTPLYGAVGSGSTAPTAADTQLTAELGRQTVGAGASSPATPSLNAQVTWLFYFPQPSVTWTVAEAGIFANASMTTNSGILLDHFVFSPTVSVPTSDTLILQAAFSVAGM